MKRKKEHFGTFVMHRGLPFRQFSEAKKGAVWYSSRAKKGAKFGHVSEASKDVILKHLSVDESAVWHFSQAKKDPVWLPYEATKRCYLGTFLNRRKCRFDTYQ
jgi:hypothetical protein